MSPISKAIQEVKWRIPEELLQAVFIDGSRFGRVNFRASLEEQMLSLVVRPRVLVDCNLVGGITQIIPLAGLGREMVDNAQWATVIRIPKARTFGKSILTVEDVNFFSVSAAANYIGSAVYGGSTTGSMFNPTASDNSAMMAAVAGVLSAQDKIPYTSTSRIDLVAENTILLRDGWPLEQEVGFLRCKLENDENMNNLQPSSYRYFSDLVEFAIKSYIYKELKIKVDVGELRYGATIGAFREVLETFSDAEQSYRDFLTNTWAKVAFMNDDYAHTRYLGMLIGGNR
jgi:hypothetical protein